MASIKASEQQSFFDVAIQKLGSTEAAFLLAMENGMSITDELQPGLLLQLPVEVNASVAGYYAKKGLVPASYTDTYNAHVGVIEVIYWSNNFNQESGIKAIEKQSVFDIAVQKLGSAEASFLLAIKNGYSITSELYPGQIIELPEVWNADVTGYYKNKGVVPATEGLEIETGELILQGIGYWAIEVDFVVS